MHMNKKVLIAAAIVSALPLAACGPKTDAAQNVESGAENSADMMEANAADIRSDADNASDAMQATAENKADALENKADATREAGEEKADAMDEKAGH
jgi:hypothetical protein